jgi:sugar phosphate isomerase/epimerase
MDADMYRIGTTSYIIPADILPNVEYLAPRVDDVQLVLFEIDEYGSNLPDAALRQRLAALATEHHITYTVHLPLDLRLGDGGADGDVSLVKAHRVIEATRDLDPFAYTLHLDGRLFLNGQPSTRAIARWQDQSTRAIEVVAAWVRSPHLLCIENVERWDPELFAPVLARVPVSRTIDVGHLWLQKADPVVHLEAWLDRTRVVHLHGIAARDHASLAHVPAADLDSVLALLQARFSGVLTIEVFGQADLQTSMEILNGYGA